MKTLSFVKQHKFVLAFVFILCVKFVLAGLFSSDYQDSLFMPFVEDFIKNGGNPYQHFEQKQMFPYPPLMLFVESVGGLLSLLAGSNLFLARALFKLPLFFFDILCFYFLYKMFPKKKLQITVIYFCSPILLYSTYMHGQLDIIPTALLTVSIYFFLFQNKNGALFSSLLISAALCTKLHLLAILPLFFIFKAKQSCLKNAVLYELLIPFFVTSLFVFPFLSDGFVKNVLFNQEQSVLTQVSLNFASLKIYIPILAVLLIYLRLIVIARMNRELFFGFSAILFSVFLILLPPMPGWYMWILPFLVVFYIDIRSNRKINFLIFSLLNLMYLFYFVFAHDTPITDLSLLGKSLDFIKTQNPMIKNICFTMMFAVHAYIIYYIYFTALKGNSLYKRQNASFVIGISGDSGSGKSTLVGIFKALLGENKILALECDGDHKWNRADENWNQYTHLNPVANYLYRQANDIEQLRAGKSIFRTEYNHSTGLFDAPHKVLPKPYILVTGLHALYLPKLRALEELKIYMDIDENLRRLWKIQRDVHKRGHSLDDVLSQIEDRMPDFHKYIEPQRQYADLIIRYFDKNLFDCTNSDYVPNLSFKITATNEVNFEPLIQELSKHGVYAVYEFDENMMYQSLVFEGANFEENTLPVMDIAYSVVSGLDFILMKPIVAKNDMWSIIALVILMMINEKMERKGIANE
ncbi:MAG: hypothetical protein ACI4LX_11645 [Treponema sp.]